MYYGVQVRVHLGFQNFNLYQLGALTTRAAPSAQDEDDVRCGFKTAKCPLFLFKNILIEAQSD